ncbi:twin-arginine translocation signal domain-containing protein [Streptomyces griseofuscus]|uniref:twin-arginine translocation signal domain-containing protein n=1 Tax=Streptomyces griseofuscus TaxID=146922 RepID=UPI0033EE0EC0
MNRRRFLTASAYSTAAATLPFQPVQEAAVRTRTVSGAGVVGHADVAAVRDSGS